MSNVSRIGYKTSINFMLAMTFKKQSGVYDDLYETVYVIRKLYFAIVTKAT